MALANAADANVFLPTGFLSAQDGTDGPQQTQAEAYIRAYLYGRVPMTTMDTWSTGSPPGTGVPNLVRGIAGRLVAAYLYRAANTGDINDENPWSTKLITEADALLDGICSGRLVIPELEAAGVDVGEGVHINDTMFYPNDTAIQTPDDIMFRIRNEY